MLARTARGRLRYEISAVLNTFCAACSVPEIGQLAQTIFTWQEPMILAIQTGHARSEGFNRIVKHIGRITLASEHPRINAAAYGGPAPANHGEHHPAPGSAPVNSEEPSKSDLDARPMFNRMRAAIEAHLTIVFTALAVSHAIQSRTGLSIVKVIKQLRPLRSASITNNGATQTFPPAITHTDRKILTDLGFKPGY